jgi:hypothetical protein
LVEKEGIEPSSTACKAVVLPLNDIPKFGGRLGGQTLKGFMGLVGFQDRFRRRLSD